MAAYQEVGRRESTARDRRKTPIRSVIERFYAGKVRDGELVLGGKGAANGYKSGGYCAPD
jgi:hypothetical protein